MKKSFNILLFTLSVLFISSCNNKKEDDNFKTAVVAYNSCYLECSIKEQLCWDEYEKCTKQADEEWNTAMNICDNVPEANRRECINNALTNYRNKLGDCKTKLKLCLAQLEKCREECRNRLTVVGGPDTR